MGFMGMGYSNIDITKLSSAGKEVWLVKACGVDGFYTRLENGVMLSLFKKTRSAQRFDS